MQVFSKTLPDPDFKYFLLQTLFQIFMLMKIIFLHDLLHGYFKQQ